MRSNRNELRQTTIGTIGSENVFADLGLPDADNRLLKSRLVAKIDDVIEKRGLTQAEAGRIMGIPQPKVSELRNGRTNDYSVERLYRLLNNLGVGVSVVLEQRPDWTKPSAKPRQPLTPSASRPTRWECEKLLLSREYFSKREPNTSYNGDEGPNSSDDDAIARNGRDADYHQVLHIIIIIAACKIQSILLRPCQKAQ